MLKFDLKPIADMSVREKIGQIVMCGFQSPYYDDDAKQMVEEYGLGNIILFTRNFRNTSALKTLCRDLYRNITDACGTMPLIAIDQEGGTVTRLMKEVSFAPSAMSVGASAVTDGAYEVGKALGRDMIKLGINMDLAPVAEINNGCADRIQNVRSFGADPEKVSRNVGEYIRGLSEYGVIATAKHFPGTGDCNIDTHIGLPVIEASPERLMNHTMLPFRENIGVPAVMACHALFRAVEDLPASLSRNCLTGILREKLGYRGLVISDSLTMGAITGKYGLGEAAVMGIIAGLDIALVCHRNQDAKEVIDAISAAYRDGRITDGMLDEKVARVLEAKRKTVPYLEKYFNNDDGYTEDKAASARMQEIVDRSVTLIRGTDPRIGPDTLILTPSASIASQAEDVFDERDVMTELEKHYGNRMIRITKEDFGTDEIMAEVRKHEDVVIIAYDAPAYPKQTDVFNRIIAEKKTSVISLKGPFDLRYYNGLQNYACLYEYTPNSIRTLIGYLDGRIRAEGKLPL